MSVSKKYLVICYGTDAEELYTYKIFGKQKEAREYVRNDVKETYELNVKDIEDKDRYEYYINFKHDNIYVTRWDGERRIRWHIREIEL